jgi:hypothetical protein
MVKSTQMSTVKPKKSAFIPPPQSSTSKQIINQTLVTSNTMEKTPLESTTGHVFSSNVLKRVGLRKRTFIPVIATQRKSKRTKQAPLPTITPSPALLGTQHETSFMKDFAINLMSFEKDQKKERTDSDNEDAESRSSCISSLDGSVPNYAAAMTTERNTQNDLPEGVMCLICPFLKSGQIACACAFHQNDNRSCQEEGFWFKYGKEYMQSLKDGELCISSDVASWPDHLTCEMQENDAKKSSNKMSGTPCLDTSSQGHLTCTRPRRSPRLHPDSFNEIQEMQKDHDDTSVPSSDFSVDTSTARATSLAEARYNYHMDYMNRKSKSFMNEQTRTDVVDWLIDVSNEYQVSSETLSIAIGLLDRSLAASTFAKNCKSMEKKKEECLDSLVLCPSVMQLLGCGCMLLASKLNDMTPLTAKNFCYLTEEHYSKKQIIEMESDVCNILRFNLHIITPRLFCNIFLRVSHASNHSTPCSVSYNDVMAHMVDYLLEIALLQYDLSKEPPSKVAAAVICLSRATLNQTAMTPSLQYYTGYSIQDLRHVLLLLSCAHRSASRQYFISKAVFNKYSSADRKCVALKKPLDIDEMFPIICKLKLESF